MSNALKNSIARLGNKLDDHKKDAVPMKLGLAALMRYEGQARTEFPEETMRELADSIKDVGVLEPLLLRPVGGGKYEIIAGERRFRAAMMAGLTEVPVLVKQMDDVFAAKVHRAENIHRENLSTLDLAQRVQRDVDEAKGDLAAVAALYNKQKSWVSKLCAIAQGGASMTELVEEGVTADRAVLAAVSSLERKAPERAKALGDELKAAPAKSNKRAIAERFMKDERVAAPKPSKKAGAGEGKGGKKEQTAQGEKEPAWRSKDGIDRSLAQAQIVVELSPVSSFAAEFAELSKKLGTPQLAVSVRHPDQVYAIVQFGANSTNRRVYRADELRLLSVV